jgi:predicted cupin superfamily sugar epimerase
MLNIEVKNLIQQLNLSPHPEGGWFRETYRSDEQVQKTALPDRFNDNRQLSTAIYFLIEKNNFSAFHRIKSDEVWHFYIGDTLNIHMLMPNGSLETVRLGNKLHAGDRLQYVVPANVWFASEPAEESSFSLVGCTVSPGFDFADFEMAAKKDLIQEFPQHQEIIQRLTRI